MMETVYLQLPDPAPATVLSPDEPGQGPLPPALGGYVSLDWFEHAPGFVAILAGWELVFTHANDAYKCLVGCDQLLGLPFETALPMIAEQGVAQLCREVMTRGEKHLERKFAVQVPDANGGTQPRYVDFVLQPIPAGDGKGVAGLLVQGSDVTMETISQRDLQFSMTHDLLTGLPNYALFRDRLEHALRRCTRAQHPLQLAALDLDRFKRVNVLLGREGGERILLEAARRIERAAGPEATVAREGGDKFLLLFEEGQRSGADARMQAVVAALGTPFHHEGHAVYLTCCIGGASFPLGGQTADVLLLAADRALGRAKEAGAGILFWDDTHPDHADIERIRLGFALRDALAAGELRVHYQPQVDLVSGKICTVEALVRWNRDGVEVAPALLVGVAEECGLIGELGEWVLRTACAQGAAWHAMGFTGLRVAVNLSPRQLALAGLENTIVRVVAESGFPASALDLELTESLVVEDIDRALECLGTLKRLGVRLCLDDFGTGQSSLGMLQRLPIDVLKIDRSFMHQVPEDDRAAAIVDAIVTMGHCLGMRILAEGVEREAQCEFLARHMCDEIQGYYVSRPAAAEAMTALLRQDAGLAPHLLRFNRTRPTLLLVDDEPSILSSLKRLLRNEGYRILTANSGSEGLEVLSRAAVDVIVSDQRMPGMTGVEFLRSVRQLYPDTVRIVLSGFTELQTVTDAVNAGAIYKFLTKPWDDEQLRGHIQEAFSYRAMANENRLLTLEVSTANQQLASVNRELESVLARQRGEIERSEISLDIVHEALSKVPVPVLASDDAGIVVLANRAALDLFAGCRQVLGADVRHLFPGLPGTLPAADGCSFPHQHGNRILSAELRPMGSGSHSKGWLIAVPCAA
jgi:diguanylate cyclase (GGDEF)-like protein